MQGGREGTRRRYLLQESAKRVADSSIEQARFLGAAGTKGEIWLRPRREE